MGVLPLQFADGQDAESLGLTGSEEFAVIGLGDALSDGFAGGKKLTVHATTEGGEIKAFEVVTRLDTPMEVEYYKNGGILQYVLRQLI